MSPPTAGYFATPGEARPQLLAGIAQEPGDPHLAGRGRLNA